MIGLLCFVSITTTRFVLHAACAAATDQGNIKSGSRSAGMGFRRSRVASLKSKKPRIAPGLCSRRCISPSKRMSIPAAAFRSSHVIGAGTSVVLIRRIRHTAFVGPAARARSCRHALFMLRFLARGSAGTDGSVIGHAGGGLALSRRNERRAEKRRNDKSRNRKFVSHKKVSLKITGCEDPLGTHCANPMFGQWRMFGSNGETD